jgi:hypothetical protein
VIRARWWLQLVAALFPVALAAQQATQDPDDLQPANGRISDSLPGLSTLRELRDGRVLIASSRGGVLIADFTTGLVKPLAGVTTGEWSSHVFAVGGDSTLVMWRDGSLVLDGTTVVATTMSAKLAKKSVTPTYYGADNRGFLLTTIGMRPDDSATLVRTDRVTGVNDTLTRLWLRPLIGSMPFADMQEQAVLAPDGWIAVFRAEAYRVDWRTPEGKWLLGAPLVLPVLAMDAREKAVYIDMMRGFVAPGTEDFKVWPRTVELFNGSSLMMPTPDSSVLIRRRSIADARGALYDVVDRRGKLVRELELSGRERIVGFGAASVYVMVTNGFGSGGHLERHPWP